MSFVMKKDGIELAKNPTWSARMFSQHTNTSYPKEVGKDYIWEQDGYWLGWVDDPVPPPPTAEEVLASEREMMEVSRLQALIILQTTGMLPQIQQYMSLDSTSPIEKLAWDNAQVFRRTSPLVVSIGQMFGMSEIQLDDLFRQAATIVV